MLLSAEASMILAVTNHSTLVAELRKEIKLDGFVPSLKSTNTDQLCCTMISQAGYDSILIHIVIQATVVQLQQDTERQRET